jgi:hypothetical protein
MSEFINRENEADTDRRKFLTTCGKFAVVTPPAVTLLLSTSLHSGAIASSSGRGIQGSAGGIRRSHGGIRRSHGGLTRAPDGVEDGATKQPPHIENRPPCLAAFFLAVAAEPAGAGCSIRRRPVSASIRRQHREPFARAPPVEHLHRSALLLHTFYPRRQRPAPA